MIDLEYRILFVCMGNICRSPTVEAVFFQKVGFEHVLDLIEEASEGLVKFVHQKVQA